MNKRSTLVTFASAAVLLGLFNINNSQTVKADTVEQPTTDQRNTQTTTANDNDQNGKSDQDQTQTGQNTAATTDQTQNQTDQNNTAADNTNNAGNQNNTGAADTDTTNANQDTQNQVGGFTDTTQSTNDYASNSVSDTSYVQNNDAVVYNLDPQTVQMLRAADVNPKDLTEVQLKEVRKLNFNDLDKDTSTRWTYDQYAGVAKKMIDQDARYRVPYFNAKKIKNMPATVTRDAQTGKVAELEIWDSWSVQDAKTGRVVNYKGYQLMIAMMGIPQQNDAHIYLLYNKYNDNNFNHWKCAGPIFGFNAKPTDQEWSGSATMNKDGSIQLFYTDVDTREGTNHQKISTVNLKLKVNKKKNTISIAKRSHRHVLFQGDGYYYQTYKQWKSTNKGADNIAMRDAHVNYGGTPKQALQNFLKVTANDDMRSRATWANAAIGIIRLTKNENNPKVAEVLPPLVNSLMVSDEIERPNIILMNGNYYLFATTRLNRGTGDDLWQQADAKVGDNVAMLGWVSDHLTYGYKPLNGDAAVLVASVPFNWRTSTYSYYAVPVKGNKKEVLVTSYMTNRGFASGPNKRSTMAPAFLVRIDGDTTKVENIATAQGDWVYDKKSKRKSMIAKNIRGAHLKGEPIDHSLLEKA